MGNACSTEVPVATTHGVDLREAERGGVAQSDSVATNPTPGMLAVFHKLWSQLISEKAL
jgi:hypothetical protein